MLGPVNQALGGALAGMALVVGLFFLRYWRLSRDRFYAYFAGAFWLMAATWGGVAVLGVREEPRPYLYLLRLAGFALIALAIIEKNRRKR